MADDVKATQLMRRFVASAPPGHLHTVMKSLRAIVKDDALFYASAPRLCLEHMATYGLPVSLPDGEGALILSKGSHAPLWGIHTTTPELRNSLEKIHELTDEYLGFAFVDWLRRSLCVVDPLLATVVERVPLCHLNGEGDAALARLLELTHAPTTNRGLGFSANTLRVAAFLALRDALQVELSKYAARRYADATVGVSVSLDLAALSADDLEATEDQQPTADARCDCAKFSIPILTCAVFAERRHETACWAGRWVTQMAVSMSDMDRSFTIGSDGAIVSPRFLRGDGATRVDFTYYEAGNIQMESTEKIDFVAKADTPGWIAPSATAAQELVATYAGTVSNPVKIAPTSSGETVPPVAPPETFSVIARRIARQLELSEDSHQEKIMQASRGPELSNAAMRPLRRKLPVTRQLYDFGGSDTTTEVRRAFTSRTSGAENAGSSYAQEGGEDE